MNYKMISYVLGCVLNIEAAAMVLPFLCAVLYDESAKWVFLLCAALCMVVGVPLVLARPKNKTMFAKEGFVAVALSWITMSIFGALPFVVSGCIPSFVDAIFETASGFTTTGASILNDVEALPKSLLFWRSFTHWIGGMGVLVFLVALLPLSGGDNFHLIKAESPGYSVGKLVPRVSSTAKILYGIYIVFTCLEVLLLKIGGLDWFESLTLSFGTAGTGGFGIVNSGIADYSSYVQVVITVFMTIFGIDFSFYYLILMRRIKSAFKLEEVWVYLGIVVTSVAVIFFNTRHLFEGAFETLKHSAFQVSSIITTTGYSTTDFDLWPQLSKTILVVLMFCGACAGSTGGGIKVSRILILFKSIIKEIKVLAHPKSTIKVKMNGRILEHETVRGVNMFFMAYMFIFTGVLIAISIDNLDFTTNFTAVVATLSNIGPGLSQVGPVCNFSLFSDFSKVILTVAMVIGRLEIFPILVLFSKNTWKR
ncbi:MAG: TrkH family potassium uptake protein [Clostridia bacterium]|nr:TrkH family potassium uptake protein [Clostridia bacterium]